MAGILPIRKTQNNQSYSLALNSSEILESCFKSLIDIETFENILHVSDRCIMFGMARNIFVHIYWDIKFSYNWLSP